MSVLLLVIGLSIVLTKTSAICAELKVTLLALVQIPGVMTPRKPLLVLVPKLRQRRLFLLVLMLHLPLSLNLRVMMLVFLLRQRLLMVGIQVKSLPLRKL